MRSIGSFVPPIVLRCLSRGQLVEQCFRLLEIERIEPFGEPGVNRSEQIAGLIPLALFARAAPGSLRRAVTTGHRD